MQMTNEEILYSFKTAAKPAAQVEILADLNGTSQDRIKEILIAQGVDPRKLPRQRSKHEKKADKTDLKKTPGSNVVTALELEIKRLDERTDEIKQLLLSLQDEMESNLKKMTALDEALGLLQDAYE